MAFLAPFRTEIIIGIFVALLGACSFVYVTYSQDRISVLEQMQARCEEKIKSFETTLAQIHADTHQHQVEIGPPLPPPPTKRSIKVGHREYNSSALEKKINAQTATTLKAFEDMTK